MGEVTSVIRSNGSAYPSTTANSIPSTLGTNCRRKECYPGQRNVDPPRWFRTHIQEPRQIVSAERKLDTLARFSIQRYVSCPFSKKTRPLLRGQDFPGSVFQEGKMAFQIHVANDPESLVQLLY